MTRLEEHRIIIDELYKKAEENPKGTYAQMMIFQLSAIATALVDISKSLAIIADTAESEVQG